MIWDILSVVVGLALYHNGMRIVRWAYKKVAAANIDLSGVKAKLGEQISKARAALDDVPA